MKLKVCGMKLNTLEVSQLQPDYLGFIFYDKSPRYFDQTEIPEIDPKIRKVGVFVNEELEDVLLRIDQYHLHIIQLHGNESAEYCSDLKNMLASNSRETTDKSTEIPSTEPVEVWKVFGIKDEFDFSILKAYESVVDKFLFDTKGKQKGGNGYTFNWKVLKEYDSKLPFLISGGIGLEQLDAVKKLKNSGLPLHGVDLNSKFEIEPGLKDVQMLNEFQEGIAKK